MDTPACQKLLVYKYQENSSRKLPLKRIKVNQSNIQTTDARKIIFRYYSQPRPQGFSLEEFPSPRAKLWGTGCIILTIFRHTIIAFMIPLCTEKLSAGKSTVQTVNFVHRLLSLIPLKRPGAEQGLSNPLSCACLSFTLIWRFFFFPNKTLVTAVKVWKIYTLEDLRVNVLEQD